MVNSSLGHFERVTQGHNLFNLSVCVCVCLCPCVVCVKESERERERKHACVQGRYAGAFFKIHS